MSVTTVSHVLNDVSCARVSAETRNKVRSAATQLGYGPNRLVQALRSRRTGMLGLVSEDIATTPHAGRILLHRAATALRAGSSKATTRRRPFSATTTAWRWAPTAQPPSWDWPFPRTCQWWVSTTRN
ncbi:hypothetical protein ARTHRO9AX_20144 [Arthrobacter sp. 9AX]|nr:hypothetical protein ARTHRO9AX_20144 [Arthrobacter sp. 9AX]